MTIQQYFGETRRPDSASRNRRAMIEKVWAVWITGVLHPSLPQDILLDLGLTERPAMVTRTLDLYVQRAELADQVQAPTTRLIDAFDRLDRALLIVGAPGAGKTTLLLTLARDLLIRAAQDLDQPIPVVFPLSSWASRRRPLADWLIDALNEQYDVPRKTGQAWIDADHILPLLDGLDEVASEHRTACVEAINTFRQDHGLLPLAVCSRIADYDTLRTRLRLQGAIVVQPLTQGQVETYLMQIGPPVAAVHEVLQDDPTLWELLDTPLMLFVIILTYAGQLVAPLCTSGTLQEQRRHLFEKYVDRMFQRRSAMTRDHRQRTERWLASLAWQMTQHSQTIFYLERMQPDWLPQGHRRALATGVGLLAGLVGGLLGGLGVGLLYGLVSGLVGGLGSGLLLGLLGGVHAYSKNIETVEIVHWSWSAFRSQLPSLLGKLLYGLGIMLVVALLIELLFKLRGLGAALLYGLGSGLTIWLSNVLFDGLFSGLSYGEIQTKVVPNEGIHRSARHALRVGLTVALLNGVLGGVLGRLSDTLHFGLLPGGFGGLVGALYLGLFYGVLGGLVGALVYGGMACLQHLVLRLLLVHHGFAPWPYVRFLNAAAERLFLRQVGGGYMFIHRRLQDYFASRHTEPRDAANQDASG